MAASSPAGGPTGIGSVDFEDLGGFVVSSSGTKITVTGTANSVPDWTEFSSAAADRTGYYVPLALEGDGWIGKTMRTGEWKVVPLSECDSAHGGLIVAVTQGQKSFTFQAFATEDDARAKRNGTTYAVDLSGVEYLA